MVEYAYDAWGKPIATTGSMASTLGEDNPFRYRGYFYDEETGLYYLNQRYYNPEWNRFVNADDVLGQTGGLHTHNLFAYCVNNPVMCIDSSGRIFMLLAAAIGAVVGAVVGGVVAAVNGGNVLEGAIAGGAIGGVVGLTCGAAAGVLLAGSAVASTASVVTGASALTAVVSGGGIVAGAKMLADNVSQWINRLPSVFWSGGNPAQKASESVAKCVGGNTLEMTRLGQYLTKLDATIKTWRAASQNFANVASNTSRSIYSIQNSAYVNIGSTWRNVEYPLLRARDIIYGVVTKNGMSWPN